MKKILLIGVMALATLCSCTTVKNRYPGAEYFLNRLTHQWIMRAAKNNCIHFSFLVRCKQIF